MIDYPFDEMIGKEVVSSERLPGGINNPSYKVRCSDGESFVVQIVGEKFPDKIQRERRNVELMKKAGIPVPEIVSWDESGEVIQEKYLVKEYMGRDLKERKSEIRVSEAREIYSQLGKIYTDMHSITFENFGRIEKKNGDFKAVGSYESYRNFILEEFNKWLERGKDTPFEDKIPQLKEWLDKNSYIFDCEIKPRLIHNDFSPENIIVEEDEVKSIIDLDVVRAGNNIFDVYRVYNHFDGKEKSEAAVEAFFNNYSVELPDNYGQQIEFFNLVHPLAYIDCWKQIEENYSPEDLREMESFIMGSIREILNSSFDK